MIAAAPRQRLPFHSPARSMPQGTNGFSRDALIAISLLPFVTPPRLRSILARFGDPFALDRLPSTQLAAFLNISAADAELVKDPLHVAGIAGALTSIRDRVITALDPDYPPLLREIHDPPAVLHFRGDRSLLQRPAVAVVGSRNASPYGTNAATELARSLSSAGVTVVSGLARGVDAAAHRAALPHRGGTVAVLGTGIDLTYPRSHGPLASQIASTGVLVSEFQPDTPPRAENFPIRNRVISGLSLGTVIVEATGRSGSLITARLAAEQGREVFAVPGSIFSDRSEGCHRLVQYGAKLVHDVGDIFDEIRELAHLRKPPAESPAPDEGLLGMIPFDDALTADGIAARARCGVHELAAELLQLELDGKVRAVPGGRYVRVR
jgi:DNA processing protein